MPRVYVERRPRPLWDRFWVLEDAPGEWLDRAHGKGWPFASKDGLEQSEHLLKGPKAGRNYYRHRLFDEGGRLVRCYLKGEAALHFHLRGLPFGGQRGGERPVPALCVIYERTVLPAAATDLHEVRRPVQPLDAGEGSADRDSCSCGVQGAMLVPDIEPVEQREGTAGGAGERLSGSDGDGPDRRIQSVVGLQLLDTCQVAAERKMLARLSHAAKRLEAVGALGDRKRDALDLARVRARDHRVELDHEVVECGPRIVDPVSEDQAPVGIDGLQVVDIERVLPLVRIDLDGEAVDFSLLKPFDRGGNALEVAVGPPGLVLGVVERVVHGREFTAPTPPPAPGS